jgi:hypothetical protein
MFDLTIRSAEQYAAPDGYTEVWAGEDVVVVTGDVGRACALAWEYHADRVVEYVSWLRPGEECVRPSDDSGYRLSVDGRRVAAIFPIVGRGYWGASLFGAPVGDWTSTTSRLSGLADGVAWYRAESIRRRRAERESYLDGIEDAIAEADAASIR